MAEILVLAIIDKLENKCKALRIHLFGTSVQFFLATVPNSGNLHHFLLSYCVAQGLCSVVFVLLQAQHKMAAMAAAAAAGAAAAVPSTPPAAMQAPQGAEDPAAAMAATGGGSHGHGHGMEGSQQQQVEAAAVPGIEGEAPQPAPGRKERKRARPQEEGCTVDWALTATDRGYLLESARKVDLACIQFDTAQVYGQPRQLDDHLVTQRMADLAACPPVGPIRDVVLLAIDSMATSFVALGGQHTCRALQRLQDRAVDEGRALPAYLRYVRARVLKYATPRGVAERWAGWHQNTQLAVAPMALSRWAECYLRQARAVPTPPRASALTDTPSSSAMSTTTPATSSSTPATSSAAPAQQVQGSQAAGSAAAAVDVEAAERTRGGCIVAATANTNAQLRRIIAATSATGHKRHTKDVCHCATEGAVHMLPFLFRVP